MLRGVCSAAADMQLSVEPFSKGGPWLAAAWVSHRKKPTSTKSSASAWSGKGKNVLIIGLEPPDRPLPTKSETGASIVVRH